jgi:hypothetical protein
MTSSARARTSAAMAGIPASSISRSAVASRAAASGSEGDTE